MGNTRHHPWRRRFPGNYGCQRATFTEVSGPVNWAVNGIAGGNATVGAITTAGQYEAPATIPNPNTPKVSAMAMGITGTSSLSVIRPKANLAPYYPCELTTGAFTMSIGGTNFAPDMILQASGLTVTTSMCRRGARRLLARFRPA